ncbi:carbonic anhydrase [Jatrophihabitans sp. GAS493]|uniref:beta-class carbonic anhydrase n=1 Tax=Jatrophihabitans sp. GAS493 TaxID=1907575 RepID=UPI000BBF69D3|nr:carbonic anhydrase [Jatrophihabitans sp. GAS493]SOD72342.1 carbonic anhydrase [Jatrophihabitans sp. GAS493]
MSAIDHLIHDNDHYVSSFPGARPVRPKLRLTVVTCMDSRLDLFGALGLDIGDAHLLRNAGGVITDDVLRSLAISQRAIGTREIVLIHHTDCGMFNFNDDEFRATLASETGEAPPWRVPGFTDLVEDVRLSLTRVRECPWLPYRDSVRGFVFDVATARITEVTTSDATSDANSQTAGH